MIPYFFAHDLQNFARLMPEYLAQMYDLKKDKQATWKFFEEGNFSVNKSAVPFSAIGADHGIEGLLINKAALHRFGLVAPELNRISD